MKTFSLTYTLPATVPDDAQDGGTNPVLNPSTGQPYAPFSFVVTIGDPVLSADQTPATRFGLANMYDVPIDFGTLSLSSLGLDTAPTCTGPIDRVQDLAELLVGTLFVTTNMAPYLTGSTFITEDEYTAKWAGITVFDPANGTPGGPSGGGGGTG